MRPTGELIIDLAAIQANWKLIKQNLGQNVECGAVVKADAYGLGVEPIVAKLVEAGCRSYFVANFEEALELRGLLPNYARIFILCGCDAGEELEILNRGFIPVIISLAMFERWLRITRGKNLINAAALKINTGMNRLGLEVDEVVSLLQRPQDLTEAGVGTLMSHLACADEPHHTLNELQLVRFNQSLSNVKKVLPAIKASLANSSGIFLTKNFHFDLVRPGIAIYGGNPQPSVTPNPMAAAVNLNLPVLQVRRVLAGETVGYGATNTASHDRTLAVAAGGYADGIMRIMGNRGYGSYNGKRLPIIGRISMDSTVFDISDIPQTMQPREGEMVELLGRENSADELAQAVGTISYELLTSIGSRFRRTYIE